MMYYCIPFAWNQTLKQDFKIMSVLQMLLSCQSRQYTWILDGMILYFFFYFWKTCHILVSTCGGKVIVKSDSVSDDDTTVFWYIFHDYHIHVLWYLSVTSINTIVLTWYMSWYVVILWYFRDNLVQATWKKPEFLRI